MTASRYELPSISGMAVQARRAGKTVQELEDVERRAYEEAYAKGRAEGLASAEKEMRPQLQQLQARVERLDAIIGTLARPLHELDAEVEDQLVHLALTVARHLVRRELRIDPSQVIAIIRETVRVYGSRLDDFRLTVLHGQIAGPGEVKVEAERVTVPFELEAVARSGAVIVVLEGWDGARLWVDLGPLRQVVECADRVLERPPLLVILDSHGIIYRSYFALRDVLNVRRTGEPVAAVFGYANSLLHVLDELRPTYVIAAWDGPQPTFRHDADTTYKATRLPMPDDLRLDT